MSINKRLRLLAVLLSVGSAVLLAGCSGSEKAIQNAESQYPTVLRPASFDTVYNAGAVDERPKPVGGMTPIYQRLTYPGPAREAGLTGRVIVQFVVAPDSQATNIRVTQSVHSWLDDEVRRVVHESAFTPGQLDDQPVPTRMELPMTFRTQTL